MTDYTRVVGIDPSLTSTGVALVTKDGAHVRRIQSSGKRNDTIADRAQRIGRITGDLAPTTLFHPANDWLDRCTLAVIEKPAPSRGSQASKIDLYWLWGRVVEVAIRQCAGVALVPPSTRAKWATGKGNADKGAVAAAITRLRPDVELSCSDEADALCLALMGAQALGWTGGAQYRHDALAACEWPADIAARVLRPYETEAS